MRFRNGGKVPAKLLRWAVAQDKNSKSLNDIPFIRLVRECQDLQDAKKLHLAFALKREWSSSWKLYVSNAIIEMYGRCAAVDDARRVFDATQDKSLSLSFILRACLKNDRFMEAKHLFDATPDADLISCTSMVSAYGSRGMIQEAKAAFDRIQQDPDAIAWNAMLMCYARNGGIQQMKLFLMEMPRRSVASFNTVITTFAESRHFEEAISMFQRMPLWDSISKTSVLDAYVQKGSLKEARFQFESLEFENTMQLNTMLKAFAVNGYLDEAKLLFFEDGRRRDVISWTTMLVGDLNFAEAVFLRMPSYDSTSTTAMLCAYSSHGRVLKAQELFQSMPNLDTISWNAILCANARAGLLEKSKLIFSQMPAKSVASWNALLVAYVQHGCMEDAEATFHKMATHDFMSWNAMLARYGRDARLNDGMQLLRRMQLEGGSPNAVSFVSILVACNHSGRLEYARDFFVSMTMDYGIQPCLDHYSCMIDLLGRTGHLEEAEELADNMPFVLDVVSGNALLGSCRNHKDHGRAQRAARNVLSSQPGFSSVYKLLASAYM